MQEVIKIYSKAHPNIQLKAIPGHFVTPNSHINHFLDMTTMKTRLSEASIAAKELSRQIMLSTVVDTIVCIDGCEIIGAFLAEELTRAGVYSRNEEYRRFVSDDAVFQDTDGHCGGRIRADIGAAGHGGYFGRNCPHR